VSDVDRNISTVYVVIVASLPSVISPRRTLRRKRILIRSPRTTLLAVKSRTCEMSFSKESKYGHFLKSLTNLLLYGIEA